MVTGSSWSYTEVMAQAGVDPVAPGVGRAVAIATCNRLAQAAAWHLDLPTERFLHDLIVEVPEPAGWMRRAMDRVVDVFREMRAALDNCCGPQPDDFHP